jgi:hypothetical protein
MKMRRTWFLLAIAGVLMLPAIVVVCGPVLDAGFHTDFAAGQTRLLAGFGLTKESPLEVRRSWFATLFIFAPLFASVVAGMAALRSNSARRFASIALSLVAAVVAVFGIIRSFD